MDSWACQIMQIISGGGGLVDRIKSQKLPAVEAPSAIMQPLPKIPHLSNLFLISYWNIGTQILIKQINNLKKGLKTVSFCHYATSFV